MYAPNSGGNGWELLFIVFLGFYVLSWYCNRREEANDPTVSNIIYELMKYRDAVKCYLAEERYAINILSENVNNIAVLRTCLESTGTSLERRYVFLRKENVLWIGCSLRQWGHAPFYSGSFLSRGFYYFLLGHPLDKLDVKNCQRLARRASEIGLYGSADFELPPRMGEESLFRRKDDVVWMKSSNASLLS
jgi:hypothetical protein